MWFQGCYSLLVVGFNPSEKYESQWEGLSHILWKIKNVPNHQPDLVSSKVEHNLNDGSSYTTAAIVKDTIQKRFSNPMILMINGASMRWQTWGRHIGFTILALGLDDTSTYIYWVERNMKVESETHLPGISSSKGIVRFHHPSLWRNIFLCHINIIVSGTYPTISHDITSIVIYSYPIVSHHICKKRVYNIYIYIYIYLLLFNYLYIYIYLNIFKYICYF